MWDRQINPNPEEKKKKSLKIPNYKMLFRQCFEKSISNMSYACFILFIFSCKLNKVHLCQVNIKILNVNFNKIKNINIKILKVII